MGLFTKSLLVIIIAVSLPLVYRQFADDSTVKFMSTYYSNYKSIDQFLRQSAGHLDQAKNYLPNSERLKGVVEKVNKHLDNFVKSAQSTLQKRDDEDIKKPSIRIVECPGEDLQGKKIRLWSKQELAKFDGNSGQDDILVGFLGIVYNVTNNLQHYGQGAEYNSFAGRDATRAFITGNFTHDLNDELMDLEVSLYPQLESWISFYEGSYSVVGRIEGRFYDSKGCATKELDRVKEVFVRMAQQKEVAQKQEVKIPECNSEWNGDLKQGRVWCSTQSGGVQRDWVGVPRIYSTGENGQRCVCFNKDAPDVEGVAKYMSVYPGCNPEASDCPTVQ